MGRLTLFISITMCVVYLRAADENKAEYHLMCKIFRTAITQPVTPRPPGDKDPNQMAEEIIKTMDFLNYSTADRTLYDFIYSTKELGDDKDGSPATKGLAADEWANLKARFNDLKEDGENSWKNKFPRPKSDARIKSLHLKIGRLRARATGLSVQVQTLEANLQNALEEARLNLLQAAFGTAAVPSLKGEPIQKKAEIEANEASFFSLSSDTGSKCNSKEDGTAAGKSIVSDIACLCGLPSNPSSANACGSGPGLGSQQYRTPSNGLTVWNELKTGCASKTNTDPQPNPGNLYHLISEFNSMLGKNGLEVADPSSASHTVGRQHILGVYNAAAAAFTPCDGTAPTSGAAHGICVNYGDLRKAGKEIPWVAKLIEAAAKLREADEKFQDQNYILKRLEAIEETALDLYAAAGDEPESEIYQTTVKHGETIASKDEASIKQAAVSNAENLSATRLFHVQPMVIFAAFLH